MQFTRNLKACQSREDSSSSHGYGTVFVPLTPTNPKPPEVSVCIYQKLDSPSLEVCDRKKKKSKATVSLSKVRSSNTFKESNKTEFPTTWPSKEPPMVRS